MLLDARFRGHDDGETTTSLRNSKTGLIRLGRIDAVWHLVLVSRNDLRNVVSQEVYTANLGFVGLGVMGSRMVKRLLEAGHTVTGYNRTKSKAQWLLDAGMK